MVFLIRGRGRKVLTEWEWSTKESNMNISTGSQQTILLIADDDFIAYSKEMLADRTYTIYTAANMAAADTCLTTKNIDLVIVRGNIQSGDTEKMAYGGWQTYSHLRQMTSQPILAIGHDSFEANPQKEIPTSGEQIQPDLRRYLTCIDLLFQTIL